jgi:hypothetical protein
MTVQPKITVSVGMSSRHSWPNGKPVALETLPDGRTRHTLEDGRAMTVGVPNYRLDYLSTWVGAEEGETYSVNITIAGLSNVEGFFEVWNFDIGEVRNYSFAKTVCVTHLQTGEVFTGAELEASLRA